MRECCSCGVEYEPTGQYQKYCQDCRISSKLCSNCGQEYTANRLTSWCKKCHNDRHKRDEVKDRLLNRLYGITLECYKNMLHSQASGCAICGEKYTGGRSFPVDHSHQTGKVRAILCNSCNRCLGMLKEDVEVMLKMVEYVNKHRGIPDESF